jgi:hypothetical protein
MNRSRDPRLWKEIVNTVVYHNPTQENLEWNLKHKSNEVPLHIPPVWTIFKDLNYILTSMRLSCRTRATTENARLKEQLAQTRHMSEY